MIFVPKVNLLEQTKNDLVEQCGISEAEIGIVGGGLKEIGRKITISTYQSHMANMRAGNGYKKLMSRIEAVHCDEAHRSLGEQTKVSLELTQVEEESENEALEMLNRAVANPILKIGYTATPRLAEKGVADEYGRTEISRVKYSDLVKAGVLVPFKLHHTDGTIVAGQLSEEEEVELLSKQDTYRKLLRLYKTACEQEKLQVAAFCVNIKECGKFREIAEQEFGLRTKRVTSAADDKTALAEAEKMLKNGEIDIIVTVDKLTEGWNFPALDGVIYARGSKSPARIIQACGRASRISVNKSFAHIFETSWRVGKSIDSKDKKADDEDDEDDEENESKNPPNIMKVGGRKALNLVEAFLQNGEDLEGLQTMFAVVNGEKMEFEVLEELTFAELRAGVLLEKRTAKDWAEMDTKEKKAFKIEGLGLVAIATRFGVAGKPAGNHSVHLELGRKIYGDCPELKDELTLAELRAGVLLEKRTAKDWAEMDKKEKQAFKIEGLGLDAIATRFGVAGRPAGNHSVHLELGRKIYGEVK